MPRAVGHAIGRAVAAEGEVGCADGADRPAALARGEVEQRAGLGAHHIRDDRLRGEQRPERQPLGEDMRAPGRGAARRRGGGRAPSARETEPVHFADDGVARDADFLSDLGAGEPGVEVGSEHGHAFCGPGAPRIVAGDFGGHGGLVKPVGAARLGRRQGEVAPTRTPALKTEMPPLRPTAQIDALASCLGAVPHPRRRTLSPSWSIECRGSARLPGPARLTGLEGWSARGRAGRRANFLAESSVPRFDSRCKGYNAIITAL